MQRGWKSDNTPLREGQRLYYNFIGGHQNINGLTPAEMASLDVAIGQNRLLKLMQNALEAQEANGGKSSWM